MSVVKTAHITQQSVIRKVRRLFKAPTLSMSISKDYTPISKH